MKLHIIAGSLILSVVFAHQPVMDMAPRWANGYGFQVRYESFGSDSYLDASESKTQTSFIQNTMWFEGVYTWKRSIRATFKLPYRNLKSENQLIDGGNPTIQNNGVGDLILALPLKKYFNLKRSTGNFGLTPQIRLKTGDDNPLMTSKSGYGLSLSYSTENPKIYQLYDFFGWRTDDKATLLGFDVNIGWHPVHNNSTNSGLFLMWDGTFRKKTDASGAEDFRIHSGPQIVLYKGNIMGRFILKFPVMESSEQTNLSKGTILQTGIGFVF